MSHRFHFASGENMKNIVRAMALGAALAVAATAVPSMEAMSFPATQDQDHHDQAQHPNYSNNRYYKLGNREGYQDHQKKVERKDHNHNYRNDVDRQAHDYGYQRGLQGQRGYHNDSDRPH
jgi:hypothetical protein